MNALNQTVEKTKRKKAGVEEPSKISKVPVRGFQYYGNCYHIKAAELLEKGVVKK